MRHVFVLNLNTLVFLFQILCLDHYWKFRLMFSDIMLKQRKQESYVFAVFVWESIGLKISPKWLGWIAMEFLSFGVECSNFVSDIII